MPRMTIEIPDLIYDKLADYQKNRKPHLSIKDVIVESVDTVLTEQERLDRIRSGETETQYSGPITEQAAEDAR